MEMAANFFIPIPGPKMTWMFGELGYDYSINYNDRVGNKPIRWDYLNDARRKRLNQVYSTLNQMKTQQDLFSTADYQIAFQDSVKRLHLNSSSMKATILGNFGIRASWTDPHFQHDGWWYEFWTGDSVLIQDVNGRMNFRPGEYRFYTDVRLKKPDIISGTDDKPAPYSAGAGITVYPNPANEWLYVDPSGMQAGEATVRVIDLQGRIALISSHQAIQDSNVFRLDISKLESGIYFIEIQTNQDKRVARWIKCSR
jgi:hypothetical protein